MSAIVDRMFRFSVIFWINWLVLHCYLFQNMFQTLKCLAVIGAVTFFSGHKLLKKLALGRLVVFILSRHLSVQSSYPSFLLCSFEKVYDVFFYISIDLRERRFLPSSVLVTPSTLRVTSFLFSLLLLFSPKQVIKIGKILSMLTGFNNESL